MNSSYRLDIISCSLSIKLPQTFRTLPVSTSKVQTTSNKYLKPFSKTLHVIQMPKKNKNSRNNLWKTGLNGRQYFWVAKIRSNIFCSQKKNIQWIPVASSKFHLLPCKFTTSALCPVNMFKHHLKIIIFSVGNTSIFSTVIHYDPKRSTWQLPTSILTNSSTLRSFLRRLPAPWPSSMERRWALCYVIPRVESWDTM